VLPWRSTLRHAVAFHSSSATRRSLQHGAPLTLLRGSRNPSGGFHGGCASLAAP